MRFKGNMLSASFIYVQTTDYNYNPRKTETIYGTGDCIQVLIRIGITDQFNTFRLGEY